MKTTRCLSLILLIVISTSAYSQERQVETEQAPDDVFSKIYSEAEAQFMSERTPMLKTDLGWKIVSPEEYIKAQMANASPDGVYHPVAVPDGWNQDCYLVRVNDSKVLFSFSGSVNGSKTFFAAISPNNQFLVAHPIFETKIGIWNLPDGEVGNPFVGLKGFARSVSFSPDEKWFAALSAEGQLMIWDVESREVKVDQEFGERAQRVHFNEDKFVIEYANEENNEAEAENWIEVNYMALSHDVFDDVFREFQRLIESRALGLSLSTVEGRSWRRYHERN